MKILYAVQGTGNGHLSRAMDVIPCLQKRAQTDILVSGIQADLELPFEVKYRMRGLSFIFGKKGGVDLWRTFLSSRTRKLVREINQLPVDKYDLVINDFEPVSAWACHLKDLPCVGLSHQNAVLDPTSPKPEESDTLGKFILKNYAPSTAHYGFHFKSYSSRIFTPVIRQQVREQKLENLGHFTVYLPSYDDTRLFKQLLRFPQVEWQVFSKHNRAAFRIRNVRIQPIHNESFIKSMATSAGVLCGAGFETPAEALFMKKKLMVIPMKNQFEQHLNAAALIEMGVPSIKKLKPKNEEIIAEWIGKEQIIPVDFPNQTQEIIDRIMAANGH
ncbi:conserved hypothetical protein [bacterium A37T11]|nr:conserved hypothetical protein [bacterium A37T11]